MHDSPFLRGFAAFVCGLWLYASETSASRAAYEDSVEVIQLRGGQLKISNFRNADLNPKVEIKGREFSFGGESTRLYKKFRFSDRDILVFDTHPGGRNPSTYDILAVEFNGVAHQYETLFPNTSPWDGIFVIKQKGDTLYLDLGFDEGLKADAVLSSKGLTVSKKPIPHASFDRKDCRWLYEQALDDCVRNSNDLHPCDDVYHPMATVRGLNPLEQNPRWAVAKDRFELACKKACETKKSPPRAAFAKDVCGP